VAGSFFAIETDPGPEMDPLVRTGVAQPRVRPSTPRSVGRVSPTITELQQDLFQVKGTPPPPGGGPAQQLAGGQPSSLSLGR